MPDPHMHVELHPLTLPALKAGPCGPHLGLPIGEALGGGGIQQRSGYQPTTQTNKHTNIDIKSDVFKRFLILNKIS